jgi:diguanylate cyclase (GGDEF)-like protein
VPVANGQQLAAARLLAHLAVAYLVVVAERDEARRSQQELLQRGLRDHLTGLANRDLLFDRLGQALVNAKRRAQLAAPSDRVAVLFIDLDGFKTINDTFGHATGDAVLVECAHRMASAVRAQDTLARLAGDEFVLVCEDLPQATPGELDEQVAAVTDRLHRALSEPFTVAGVELTVSASVGAALSTPSSSPDSVLAEADAAMYRAKQQQHRSWPPTRRGYAGRPYPARAYAGFPAPGSPQLRRGVSRLRWSIGVADSAVS